MSDLSDAIALTAKKARNAGFLLLHDLKKTKAKDARSAEQLRRFNASRHKSMWAESKFIQNPYEHITKKLSEDVAGQYIVEKSIFNLNIIQKIFVTLEVPQSCPAAHIISLITSFVITAGVILFVLSTNQTMSYQPDTCDDPVCHNDTLCPNKMICHPVPYDIFDSVDLAFIIYFTIDYGLRLLTLWSAPSSLAGIDKTKDKTKDTVLDTLDFKHLSRKYFIYMTKTTNLIDLSSILPFYVIAGIGASGSSKSSSFVRVLRLSRLLRVLKLGKNSATIELLSKTFIQSSPSLSVAGFIIFLIMLVFASTLYMVESGDYYATSDYPDGQYLRWNLLHTAKEAFPFDSIGTSIYYTIVTMTTVGYGEMYPTSQLGRALASLGCIVGILVLALPLAVISNNFTANYQLFVDSQNANFKEVELQNLSEVKAETLQAAVALENSALADDKKMKNPEFWEKHSALHKKLVAVIASEKASVLKLGTKVAKLDSIDDEIERTKLLSQAQRENLKRIKRLCQHIIIKLKAVGGIGSAEKQEEYARIDSLKKSGTVLFTPSIFVSHTADLFYTERVYQLGMVARIFLCLEDSLSCWIGGFLFFVNTCIIILGLTTYILSSETNYQYKPTTCDNPVCNNDPFLCPGKQICEPHPLDVFNQIDQGCVIFFTIEYVSRILTLWAAPCRLAGLVSHYWDDEEAELAEQESRMPMRDPPELSLVFKYISYMLSFSNIIDVVAIIPSYVAMASSSSSSSSSAFVRILRLSRALRLLKLMKNNDNMQILYLTMKESIPVMGILAFYVMLITICFGSIIYIAEGGRFEVSSDFEAPGAFTRPNILSLTSEQTPLSSISVGIYWAMVCCTTLGYGDIYPTSILGRSVACVCAFLGILVLALPISVVGSTFITQSYEFQTRRAEEKKLMKEEVIADHKVDDIIDKEKLNEEKVSEEIHTESMERFHKSEIIFENKVKQVLENVHELEAFQMMEVAMELLKDLQVYQNEIKKNLQDVSACTDELVESCIELKNSHISRIQILRQSIVDPHKVIVESSKTETNNNNNNNNNNIDDVNDDQISKIIDKETVRKVIRQNNFEL